MGKCQFVIMFMIACIQYLMSHGVFHDVPLSYCIGEIVTNMFPGVPSSAMQITPLKGGYSGAGLLLMEVNEKKYVAKIHSDEELAVEIDAELYALQAAAQLQIAPEIYYITDDTKGIMMKYVEGGAIAIERLRDPKMIERMACVLRKAHSIPRSPFASRTKAKDVRLRVIDFVKRYQYAYADVGIKAEIEGAIHALVHELEQFNLCDSERVMIHGDLHSRNICFDGRNILLIDWCFSSWDDPFFDIASLSVASGYTDEDEQQFFNAYLGRKMTKNEQLRYGINKRIGFLYEGLWWCFCLLRAVDQGEAISSVSTLHSYGHYSALFSRGLFSAQVAYEAALAAFQEAGLQL